MRSSPNIWSENRHGSATHPRSVCRQRRWPRRQLWQERITHWEVAAWIDNQGEGIGSSVIRTPIEHAGDSSFLLYKHAFMNENSNSLFYLFIFKIKLLAPSNARIWWPLLNWGKRGKSKNKIQIEMGKAIQCRLRISKRLLFLFRSNTRNRSADGGEFHLKCRLG